MTATVYSTGTLHAVAVDDKQSLPAPVDLLVLERERGFRADLTASPEAISGVRALTRSMPMAYGTNHALADAAELVVSELMGNAVRASLGAVALVVEVNAALQGIEVTVHDTLPEQPHRSEAAMDSAEAESGRGLPILDALTDGWTVEPSPEPSFVKMIRCRVSRAA